MKKRKGLDDSLRFMELAKKSGLNVHGCFVMGLPGETHESMDRTIRFAIGLGLNTVQFSAAVPFPGTAYFDQCREAGLFKDLSWDKWLDDGEQAPVVEYPGLSRRAVADAVDRGLKSFYLRPSFMIRFLLATRSTADLYRKMRGARNFFSYLCTEHRKR
jgi:radical SAM superfamily enzyme YgiQ (UPF0313 family)